MVSMTRIGDELRDYVKILLEAAGHRVLREVRVDAKRVDLLLELEDAFTRRQVAVECKNLSRTISQGDLTSIYADHLGVLQLGSLDEVWVVARGEFSPEARNWARSTSNFNVFTLAEFEERNEGFRTYVGQVRGVFGEGGLDAYYVPQHLADGTPLFDFVSRWIDDDGDPRPLALLGGYGMGKTSFCHYLVSRLAEGYLADASARVPIYVRLSDIAREQELDGLIAKTLAQRYSVRNYHFHKFMRLNEAGKFVLIFDGFDEMKHALSWAEFKYNFSQINRTVQGAAKVIIAGRPNAFLSDDEHNWALRGVRTPGERAVRLPGVPEYAELPIRPFSDEDARSFLTRYLHHHIVRRAGGKQPTEEDEAWITRRVAEFDRIKRKAELLRPVHLRIFAELATDRSLELRDFGVHELYTIATSRIVEREAEKPQRQRVDSATRQTVVEDIAWWLWQENEGRSLSFVPGRVPFSIIRKAFPEGEDLAEEAMSREVFSGSFIERKHGENFYFAHRSFLEFFVANRLARAKENAIGLSTIDKMLNPEILAFIADSGRLGAFLRHVLEAMQRYSGDLEFSLLQVLRDHVLREEIDLSGSQTAISVLLDYLFVYEAPVDAAFVERLIGLFDVDVAESSGDRADAAYFFVADVLRSNPREAVLVPLVSRLAKRCAREVRWAYWQARINEEATMPKLTFTRKNLPEWLFLRAARLAAELDGAGQHAFVFDFDVLFNDLFTVRKPRICLSGREPKTGAVHASVRLPVSTIAEGLPPLELAALLEVLARGSSARVGI